jgi:hypothetical protein
LEEFRPNDDDTSWLNESTERMVMLCRGVIDLPYTEADETLFF